MTKYQDEMEDDDDIAEWDRAGELAEEDKVYYGSDTSDVIYSEGSGPPSGGGLGESDMDFDYGYYDEEDPELEI
jgi:hypothetical protein